MTIANSIKKTKQFLIGKARSIRDPGIFHKLSLIAFFAWVGLGADGLSSSCYGPEEAFLTLRNHAFLGIFVALASVATIFIISTSYSQIIDLFPGGGGGYLVASKLLSPTLGMVSGCALLVDYVLTIALSIAGGTDAIFSFLPYNWHPFKIWFAIAGILVLVILNLRGVKESIVPLVPVFLLFIVTHVIVISYTFIVHFFSFNAFVSQTVQEVKNTRLELGFLGMILLVLRAYSMGAGTYTGIEAVSNGIPILREPKTKTAKKTMFYMAASLAFMVFGLTLGYLFYRVQHEQGKTLNAVLLDHVVSGWNLNIGYVFILVTLISEGALLFVAAQTGFLDGPRVLANMAIDRWVPTQFSLLSERFVAQNGVLLMGCASVALMIFSGGSVKFLVVLYSINVFITFFLSQLGMTRHWWNERKQEKSWKSKILVNGLGLMLTTFILLSVLVIKFHDGGWITIAITGSLIGVSVLVKRFYYKTRKMLLGLDKLAHVTQYGGSWRGKPLKNVSLSFNASERTAIILVNGFNGMGLHTLFNVIKLFKDSFKNFFFIQAGIIDSGNFKGVSELGAIEEYLKKELDKYVHFMNQEGFYAKGFSVIGADVAQELTNLARGLFKEYPQSVFFGGQIIFPEETFMTKLFYNHITFATQRRLHQEGIPFVIMPIRVKR